MRVAIFHDFFVAIGGGERTVLTLARGLGATVYTTELRREGVDRLGFRDVRIESLGGLWPRPPGRQVHASLRFARAHADADVFVVSGNWATYAARRHHPNVMYCHAPVRAFYDLREPWLRGQRGRARRLAAWGWITLHGAADRIAWTQVDRVVANSENTRRRVRSFHGRDAAVVYPPVDVSRFRSAPSSEFWLSVNRLYPEKRLEMQFETFRQLPDERLVVVGGHSRGDHSEGYAGRLRPPANVELRGEVTEEELRDLYAHSRGLVCTALDEDFGLTPVEAMASGKVVLAVDEGGFRETVVPGETGWLLPADASAFAAKIRALRDEDLSARADACRRRAMQFDVRVFLDRMRTVLEEAVAS